jgi:hypothetical protein
MDLSSLSNMIGSSTLLDYLDGGKMSGTAGSGTAIQLLNSGLAGSDTTSAAGDIVSLSSQAQQLLAQIQAKQAGAASGDSGTSTGVTKAAQNFIAKFFTDSGVDTTKLSDQAQQLIGGVQDLVADSGATTRDTSTDMQEAKYNGGNRQVYTLVGDGRRIRIAVDYTDGKPAAMTMTDISSDGQVISAKVTLSSDAKGVDVAETQYKYSSGILTDSLTKPILSMDLYADSATDSTGASAASA